MNDSRSNTSGWENITPGQPMTHDARPGVNSNRTSRPLRSHSQKGGRSWPAFNHNLKPILAIVASMATTLAMMTGAFGSSTDPFAGLPNVKTTAPQAASVKDGDYGVDEQRGAVTYSFPIEVPPGRNGMAPKLSLSYSSQAPLRGGIAVGWSGIDLPYVDIEPKAVPGDPKFRLNGNSRLVVVNDAKAGATEVYRAEFDAGFTRWERWGDVNAPSTTWIARNLDGSRMEFARAPQSVLNPGIVQQWVLTGQVDAYGNRILYHWDSVELNGRVSYQDQNHRRYKSFELGYIEYTYNPGAGLQAHARVNLNYFSPTYQGNSAIPIGAALSWTNGDTSIHPRPPADGIVTGARELQSITTAVRETISAPWKTVRTFSFSYDYSDAQSGAQLRYLRKIDVSGYRDACNAAGCAPVEQKLPTVTFTYGDGPNGTYVRHWDHNESITYGTSMTLPRPAGHSGSLAGATAGFMDVDGDGIRDFVTVAAEPNGSGMDVCTLTVNPGRTIGPLNAPPYKVALPTMNWKTAATSNTPSSGHDFVEGEVTERCTLGGQYVLHHENICLSGSPQTCCADDYYAILGYHFVDYNGDGRVDLLTQLWRSAGYRDVTGAAYKTHEVGNEICSTGPWDPMTGACMCTDPQCYLPGLSPLPGAPPPAPAPFDPGGHLPTGDIPGPPAIDCSEFYELIPERNWDQSYLVVPHYFLDSHTLGRGLPLHSGVPLPPPGEEGVSEAMSQDVPFTLQMNADVDANGFMDLISTPSYQNGEHYKSLGTSEGLSLWLGNGGENFLSHDVGFPVPTFTMHPNEGIFDPQGNPTNIDSNISVNASLVDVNGDGRSDLVYRESASGHLWYFPNTGDRFAKPDYDLGAAAPVSNNWYHIVTRGTGPMPDVVSRFQNVALIDVDDDGRADLFKIVPDPNGSPGALKPVAFFNFGDGFASTATDLPLPWLAARNHFQSKSNNNWALVTELADVNGDGLSDLVDWDSTYFSPTHVTNPTPGRKVTWASDVVTDAPPRLLRRIDNGRGSSTEFKYESSSALGVRMPSPTWVVTKVKTTPDVTAPANAMTTLYSYASPKTGGSIVRDSTDFKALGFLGFGQVTVSAPTPAGNLHGPVNVHTFKYEKTNGGSFADGRGYKSASYAYDGAGVLQSVDRDEWEEVRLFGSLPIVRPTSTEHHVCTLQQQQAAFPETACGSSSRNMTKSYRNYSPYLAGTQVAFFQEGGSTSMRSDDAWIQNSYATYKIHYPSASDPTYRMQPLTNRTTRGVILGSPETTSRQEVVYDSDGFPKWTKAWWGPGDNDYATTVRIFDPRTGNLTSLQKPVQAARAAATPSQDKKTSYGYDAYKLYVTLETNELGHQTITTRDLGTGAVTRVQGPQSVTVPGSSCSPGPACLNEVALVLDAFGRPTTQKATYAFGSPDASSTTLVNLITTTYDDLHNTKTESRVIDPTASGATGWVTTTTQDDPLGRVVSQATCRGVTSACPDPANDATTRYSYDSAGLLVSMTMPSPAVDGADVTYTFQHDSLGRLTKLIRPGAQAAEEMQYSVPLTDSTADDDPNARDYGFLLQRTAEAATDGKVTITRVDLAGRLVAVQECNAPSCDGIPNNVRVTGWDPTIYEYDEAGRLTSVTNADADVTSLTYDLLGHRTSIARTRLWSYEYDLNGNMTAEISPLPAGVTDDTQYRSKTTYDDLDRPVRHEPALRGLTATQQASLWIGPTNYFYDEGANGTGRLTRVEQPRPTTGPYAGSPFLKVAYRYNGMGQVLQEARTFNTTGAASADVSQSVTRTWNDLGSPMFAAWDDGQYTAANFDARGMVKQMTYTGPGSKTVIVADYGTRSRAGAPTRRGTGGEFAGQERLWTYDEGGRVLTDRIQSPAGALADRAYVFDARGLMKTASGSTRSVGVLPAPSLNDVRNEYSYDREHRLVGALEKTTGYSLDLAYSAAGNVTRARVFGVPNVPGQPTANRNVTYNYDGFDPQAVMSLDDAVSKRVATFVYDEAGNMTTRSWPLGQDEVMTWDGANQLRQVQTPDGSFERYHYDHNGQRVWAVKDTGADAGTRYWFAESETFVPAATPATKRRYLYVSDGGGVLARAERVNTATPSVELTFADALQNLSLTTTVSGPANGLKVAVSSWFHYGAFGEVLAQGGASNHRREFNGKENDATSGLRYYGARYYDPMLMRWNSGDPLYRFAPETSLDEPQRQNLYSFGLNNPLVYLDPDGRDGVDAATVEKRCDGDVAHCSTAKKNSPTADEVAGPDGETWGTDTNAYREMKAHPKKYGALHPNPMLDMLNAIISNTPQHAGFLWNVFVGFMSGPGQAPPKPVFWSGSTAAKEAAAEWARAHGGVTLEMTPVGKSLEVTTKGLDWYTEARPMWDAASKVLAEGAWGEVHVFQAQEGVKLQSAWVRVEYPILSTSPRVTNIVYHLVPEAPAPAPPPAPVSSPTP